VREGKRALFFVRELTAGTGFGGVTQVWPKTGGASDFARDFANTPG
jgi:hypothetical protein